MMKEENQLRSQSVQQSNKGINDQTSFPQEPPDVEVMRAQIKNGVASYAAKVDEIGKVVFETLDHFADVRSEYQEMAFHLKDILSKKQRLRRKDFDSMLGTLLQEMKAREDDLREMVSKFFNRKKKLVNDMLNILAKNSDQATFIEIGKKLLRLSGQTESELAQTLREYNLEQEELRAGLMRLISLEEKVTVGEFRKSIKAIRLMRKERLSGPADVLDYLRSLGDDIIHDWDRVMCVLRRSGNSAYFQ